MGADIQPDFFPRGGAPSPAPETRQTGFFRTDAEEEPAVRQPYSQGFSLSPTFAMDPSALQAYSVYLPQPAFSLGRTVLLQAYAYCPSER